MLFRAKKYTKSQSIRSSKAYRATKYTGLRNIQMISRLIKFTDPQTMMFYYVNEEQNIQNYILYRVK